MANLQSLTPNMMVENVNESVDYYRDKLGFRLINSLPETGDFNWAMMNRNDVSVMFQKRESITKEYPELVDSTLGATIVFYVIVDDIENLYSELQDNIKIIKELHTTFYQMKEFVVEDCHGYLLTFAQRV